MASQPETTPERKNFNALYNQASRDAPYDAHNCPLRQCAETQGRPCLCEICGCETCLQREQRSREPWKRARDSFERRQLGDYFKRLKGTLD